MKSHSLILIGIVGLLLIGATIVLIKKKYPLFPFPSVQKQEELKNDLKKEDSLQLVNGVFTSPRRESVTQFSLKLPQEWEVKNFNGGDIFSVEFVNGNYTLQIFQPYEGSTCVFPGDKPYEGPSEVFDKSMTIQATFGSFRMGRNPINMYGEHVIFRACSKYGPTENNQTYWGTGTKIGNIQYFVPKNYDENKIKEMNLLLQSIRLVK